MKATKSIFELNRFEASYTAVTRVLKVSLFVIAWFSLVGFILS